MAISKERLTQLIKEEATIYCCSEENNNYKILLKENCSIDKEENELVIAVKLYDNDYYTPITYYSLEDLFETKEDAEEYALYGKDKIKRTEYLNMPLWEDINKLFDKYICIGDFAYTKHFSSKGINYSFYICRNKYLLIDNDTDTKTIFSQPLTRENYDKARELCKKLFEK